MKIKLNDTLNIKEIKEIVNQELFTYKSLLTLQEEVNSKVTMLENINIDDLSNMTVCI